ncbi:MAG: radical SAM protein [Methanosarcinales archaeon]|nr:radical SAM protein [Methanosarcinales archaeon]
MKIAFGPVPSRRLGQSLGVNNIPPKVCSYSCVYCQVGRTPRTVVQRRKFFPPEEICASVGEQLKLVAEKGECVDYLTIVSDGEPTLDQNLGQEIEMLTSLGPKVAVITNSSLLPRPDVQEDLSLADLVSLKVDAVDDAAWRRVNRPHPCLDHRSILESMVEFAGRYSGELLTETMLVRGLNDSPECLQETAAFLGRIHPSRACLSVPTRPPAESSVRQPDRESLGLALKVFSREVGRVQLLSGDEGDVFSLVGSAEESLLAIMAVHPLREAALQSLLAREGLDWALVQGMMEQGSIHRVEHDGQIFYSARERDARR